MLVSTDDAAYAFGGAKLYDKVDVPIQLALGIYLLLQRFEQLLP
jgi:hypothetical protein